MAHSSDVDAALRVDWMTEVPYVGMPRKSHSFSFRDLRWHFEALNGDRSYPFYIINLHLEGRDEDMPDRFKVATHLVGSDGVMKLGSETHVLSGRSHELWSFPIYGVPNQHPDPDVLDVLELAFVFTSPRGVQSTKERIYLKTLGEEGFPSYYEILIGNYGNVLLEECIENVKLVCGNRAFFTHRTVLAARSEVFATMFRNKMSEIAINVVDVGDFDAPVIDLFVEYAYSGKIQGVSEKTAPGLYAVADKYAVPYLKKGCSDWMVRNLTEKNCIRFLTTANERRDGPLKQAILSFILDHESVLKSEAWTRYLAKQRK